MLFRSLYRTFDEDVFACFRYIEPSEDLIGSKAKPSGVYSVELYRLHVDICSTFGSLLNLWFVAKGGKEERPEIGDYFPLLEQNLPGLSSSQEIALLDHPEIHVWPFRDWTLERPPRWWTDHNKTKHSLAPETFRKGNLDNVVHSLAGLYFLVNDQYTRSTNPTSSRVFRAVF
jgi:hypothetical protein